MRRRCGNQKSHLQKKTLTKLPSPVTGLVSASAQGHTLARCQTIFLTPLPAQSINGCELGVFCCDPVRYENVLLRWITVENGTAGSVPTFLAPVLRRLIRGVGENWLRRVLWEVQMPLSDCNSTRFYRLSVTRKYRWAILGGTLFIAVRNGLRWERRRENVRQDTLSLCHNCPLWCTLGARCGNVLVRER